MNAFHYNNYITMVPSIENAKNNHHDNDSYDMTTATNLPKRNITFAVNYEVSMVNQFHHDPVDNKRVESVLESTCTTTTPVLDPSKPAPKKNWGSNAKNHAGTPAAPGKEPNNNEDEKNDNENQDNDGKGEGEEEEEGKDNKMNNNNKQVTIDACATAATPVRRNGRRTGTGTATTPAGGTTTTTTPNTTMRRSQREKRSRNDSIPLSRCRVRYDMQLVPPVSRSKAFLLSFGAQLPWLVGANKRKKKKKGPPPRIVRPPQPQPAAAAANSNIMEGVVEIVEGPQAPSQAAAGGGGGGDASSSSSSTMPPLVAEETAPPARPAQASEASAAAPASSCVINVNNNASDDDVATTTDNNKQMMPRRRSSRLLSSTANDNNNNNGSGGVEQDQAKPPSRCSLCGQFQNQQLAPFEDDTSVVWVPSKRSEWEDSVSEMTAVCTSAALRRYKKQQQLWNSSGRTTTAATNKQPFHAPLSRDYIRDRVDIDDPLNGYQIRHKTGGWLQGFVMWTNFTTWTHHFEWDSNHPMSGIHTSPQQNSLSTTASLTSNPLTTPTTISTNNNSSSAIVDSDGSLARELQACSRSGDPHGGGIVFDGIAEIGLVGGLGCGEYLLRMAIESIMTSKTGRYRYIVLQATDQSKTFYEKYGFVRVGAICRYGVSPINKTKAAKAEKKAKKAANKGGKNQPAVSTRTYADTAAVAQRATALEATALEATANATELQQPVQEHHELPIVGYRHWTHANESESSLQMHGGPSYMMCLKLPERQTVGAAENEDVEGEVQEACCSECGCARNNKNKKCTFLERMMSLAVDQKPTIEQLGSSFTPGPKPRRPSSAATSASVLDASYANEPHLLGHGKRKRHSKLPARRSNSFDSWKSEAATSATSQTTAGTYQPPSAKRRKLSDGSAVPTSITTGGPPRKRGRPPLYRQQPPSPPQIRTTTSGSGKLWIKSATVPVKRGRGRPPKNSVPSLPAKTSTTTPAKRGRPRKRPPTAATGSGSQSTRRKSLPSSSTSSSLLSSPASKKTRTRSVDSKTSKPSATKAKSSTDLSKQHRPFYSVRGTDGRFVTIPASKMNDKNSTTSVQQRNKNKTSNDNSSNKNSCRNSRTSSAAAAAVNPQQKSSTTSPSTSSGSSGGGTRVDIGFGRSDGKPTKINRSQLMKQKVKSYPRSRVHYYNRVVRPKHYTKQKQQYFFVLHYDEDTGRIRIAPMVARGVLSGKREGRARYQVAINDTDANFLTGNSNQYDVVPATMVMKTPVVANEAWDIEG